MKTPAHVLPCQPQQFRTTDLVRKHYPKKVSRRAKQVIVASREHCLVAAVAIRHQQEPVSFIQRQVRETRPERGNLLKRFQLAGVWVNGECADSTGGLFVEHAVFIHWI